jgi:hypothetical protein
MPAIFDVVPESPITSTDSGGIRSTFSPSISSWPYLVVILLLLLVIALLTFFLVKKTSKK